MFTRVYKVAIAALILSLIIGYIVTHTGCSIESSERLQNISASVEKCEYPLSDKRNPSHTQATKLYNKYISSGGKKGLDPERYNTYYHYEVRTDDPGFDWTVYKQSHPGDVSIHDDNNDKVYRVYTNTVDIKIFSPITYK